jgi:hypothetical protein
MLADFAPYAHHTCINMQMDIEHTQPDYDRSMQPAGSFDIMLGRKLGTGCQLKYSDDMFTPEICESTTPIMSDSLEYYCADYEGGNITSVDNVRLLLSSRPNL